MPGQKSSGKKKYLGLKLGEILIKMKKIKPDELESLLAAQQNAKSTLGEYLVQKNIITEDEQLQLLSYQLGIEYREDLLINSNAILSTNLPRSFIKKYNVVILNENDQTVEIALNNPFQFEIIENIRTFTKKDIKLVLAKKLDILKLSDALAGEDSESADEVIEGLN